MLAILAPIEISKGGNVLPSAQMQTAGETNRSRWDQARVRLLIAIGIIVVIAIICIAAGLLSSALRANRFSADSEKQSILRSIDENAERALRHLQSVASMPQAITKIRDSYDAAWVDRRVGQWLETFYNAEIVAVFGIDGQTEYFRSRVGGEGASANLVAELAPTTDILRSRLAGQPRSAVLVSPRDLSKPTKAVAVIQSFMGKPAIVAAVAIGEEANSANGNDRAPIVASVKYINNRLLAKIAERLQVDGLHMAEPMAGATDAAAADDDHVIELADTDGTAIARLVWRPKRPGGAVIMSVVPFVAVVFVAFALLIIFIMRHMQRTAAAIAAGERQLRHLALHDPVCGLPNRIYFSERLERAIVEVRNGGPTAAVFYIDLDHFKDVNDTLGHHIGDELILNVTRRLSQIMRDDDLVARLGGDEFAIIMTCASDSYSLQAIADRILTAICAPFIVSGHGINIGASIGIAVIDSCTQDARDILRYADMALYRAKNEGRNRACIYDAAMNADLSNRKLLESALRQAIKNDELHVVYQPIVNPSGKRVVGVETLARWIHPVQGEIPPARFIPIAEHSGLIVELGEYILRRACLDGRNWPGLAVSVNVSPLQFRRPDFVEAIERILSETAFEPNRLELELTESTLLGNLESAELSMLRLKGLGVCFALDDFGTGYSSLLYLRRFPFDKLKIDSSFVRSIEKAADAAAIVHAVVSLGRGLGMKVTAEGVETADQHLFLRAAGVHSMQGYRFGRPVAAAEIDDRLAAPEDCRVASPDQEIAVAS
ncbi:MAG TPA: EAL domain-containing protein [Xanthobacteraceae bacterium]|nr:EAL domain-containing protein [Xanthobacteraceae bacterium]